MVTIALLEGLIWSLMWMIFVYVIVRHFPWEMVHDYPKDIQEKHTIPEPSASQKHHAKLFQVIASLVIIGTVFIFGLLQFRSTRTGFPIIFLFTLIVVFTWNVVDLLLMDWIIVCTVTPKWIVLPGTEGCTGYKDYGFHFKGFLIGCVYSSLMALIVSGILYAAFRIWIWQ